MSAVSTIKAECNGYTFQWGPNKYIVRINQHGNPVWKRWNDRNGWFRRVDRTACGESTFRAALDECANLLLRAECDCSFGCDACSGDVSFGD